MVDVRWKNLAGETRRTKALLEDISRSGACLQLENPVPLGSEIHLKTPRREFVGAVRYCVYREIGYFVGVEFEEKSRWSPRAYKPQHLLDLQRLAANARRLEN